MSIKSNAFGRVTLTDEDAVKFRKQVTYGKPKAAAKESVNRGIELISRFNQNGGKVRLTLKRA